MKKIRVVMVILSVCVFLLAGCGSSAGEQQEEYKQAGIAAMASGDYEGAVEQFQQALDLSGGRIGTQEIDICYYKAAAYYQAGKPAEARQVYTALMEYDSRNADPCFLRGSIYAGERNLENALKDYKEAVSREKGDYELYIAIYENLNALGYSDEAVEYLNMALEIEGDEADNCLYRGRIYILLGQYDAAETALLKAVDKKSDEARVYLAQVYDLQGETQQAADMRQAYLDSGNTTSEGLTLLGNREMDTGNYEQALAYYQQALKCEAITNEQELRKNEVAALERCGQYDEAKEKIAAYCEDYPSDQEAAQEKAFLETR